MQERGQGRLIWPLALAAGFLVLGLATLDRYGVSWDEPLHREWGRVIWSYLVTGDDEVLNGLVGAGHYYGPLFYLLNYGLSELAYRVFGLDFTAANHLLTLFVAALGVLCTSLLAEVLAGRSAALGAAVLLCLLPPFLAHAHYNPKDIPLLTVVTAAVLFAAKTYRSHRVRDAILTGAFLGWAVATKPTALAMVPVIGGAVVVDMLATRAVDLRTMVRLTAVTALASAVSLFLTWPTLWRQPTLLLGSIRYFGSGDFWSGSVLYFGTLAPATDLPWHYMPVMLLLAFPLATVALAAVGAALMVRRAAGRQAMFETTLLLAWVAVPLLMFMKPGLARYDGMRQLFFIVPAITILGGIGWAALWREGERSPGRRRLVAAASVGLVAWMVVENVRVFPYGGSYVSDAARAMLGPHLERRFEVEYWGTTYREGMRWVQRRAAPNTVVCAPLSSTVLPWHQVRYWQPELTRADLTYDCTRDADYVMVMTRFSGWPDEIAHLRQVQPAFTISRLGSDLLYVYEVRR